MRKVTSACNKSLRHHDVLPPETAYSIIEMKKALGLTNDGYFNMHLDNGYGITINTVAGYASELRDRYDEELP